MTVNTTTRQTVTASATRRRVIATALTIIVMALMPMNTPAQCTADNTAFSPGEFISYNLYFNWKFVWVKAGTASMSTVESSYNGRPAYRASLITRGSDKADALFVLRDTLLCYTSTSLAPLYYRKGAREGKRYTVDEVFYNYPDGVQTTRLHRQRNDGTHRWSDGNEAVQDCAMDMLSMFLRARSLNPTGWKKGKETDFLIADGRDIVPAKLRYEGKSIIKADNGKKYRCLEMSYLEMEKGKYKEIVRFYVSDDDNHIPVRLDMCLRFGSAKAFLTGMKGLRGPATSEEE